jgi:hypothetical protein
MAHNELDPCGVDERGYLILKMAPIDSSLIKFCRADKVPQQTGTVQGFKLKAKPSGYMHVYVDYSASFDLSKMSKLKSTTSTSAPSLNPKRDFQQ